MVEPKEEPPRGTVHGPVSLGAGELSNTGGQLSAVPFPRPRWLLSADPATAHS